MRIDNWICLFLAATTAFVWALVKESQSRGLKLVRRDEGGKDLDFPDLPMERKLELTAGIFHKNSANADGWDGVAESPLQDAVDLNHLNRTAYGSLTKLVRRDEDGEDLPMERKLELTAVFFHKNSTSAHGFVGRSRVHGAQGEARDYGKGSINWLERESIKPLNFNVY